MLLYCYAEIGGVAEAMVKEYALRGGLFEIVVHAEKILAKNGQRKLEESVLDREFTEIIIKNRAVTSATLVSCNQ